MRDITKLPHGLDPDKNECRVIVETPRGSRIKFKFEPESDMFEISKFLPKGFVFPFEFGFVPSTIAEDGDPLDALVLMDEPAHLSCLLRTRLVGVIELIQTENGKETPSDRLIAIPVQSFDYAGVQMLSDLNWDLKQQITEYLELYNKNSGKQDRVTGIGSPQKAVELVRKASRRWEEFHP